MGINAGITLCMVLYTLQAYALSPCQYHARGLIPHDTYCHQYYDCSATYGQFEQEQTQLRECEYPQLFNKATKSCDHFLKVNCGKRIAFVNGCDYLGNQCSGRGHCRPCMYNFPSCEHLPDGPNALPYVQGRSAMYMKCFRSRFMGTERCSNKHEPLFDAVSRECTSPSNDD